MQVAVALLQQLGARHGLDHRHQCGQGGRRVSHGPVGPGAVGWAGAGREDTVVHPQIGGHWSNEMEQRQGEGEQQMNHGWAGAVGAGATGAGAGAIDSSIPRSISPIQSTRPAMQARAASSSNQWRRSISSDLPYA